MSAYSWGNAPTPMLMKCLRYVLYSKKYGVYLGYNSWSFRKITFIQPQVYAVTFGSREEVAMAVVALQTIPPDWYAMPVMCSYTDRASIMECVRAGLPGWVA